MPDSALTDRTPDPPCLVCEHLASEVVDLEGQVRVMRELLAATLELIREQEVERDQVLARYHALLDERRAEWARQKGAA
jgi:hypothetical protein